MINGNSTRLVWALISGMFISIMALIGVVWGDINGDINAISVSVKELQRDSIRVLAMENELGRLATLVDGIYREDD